MISSIKRFINFRQNIRRFYLILCRPHRSRRSAENLSADLMLCLMSLGGTSCHFFCHNIFWKYFDNFLSIFVGALEMNYLCCDRLERFVTISDGFAMNLDEVNSMNHTWTFSHRPDSQSVNIFGIVPNNSIIKSLQLNLNKWKIYGKLLSNDLKASLTCLNL